MQRSLISVFAVCFLKSKQCIRAKLLSSIISNDPRFIQCIYRYSHASKRFVEVYIQNIKLCARVKSVNLGHQVVRTVVLFVPYSNYWNEKVK